MRLYRDNKNENVNLIAKFVTYKLSVDNNFAHKNINFAAAISLGKTEFRIQYNTLGSSHPKK